MAQNIHPINCRCESCLLRREADDRHSPACGLLVDCELPSEIHHLEQEIARHIIKHGEQAREIDSLRYLLSIYHHAWETGNSIPPHIAAECEAVLKEKP